MGNFEISAVGSATAPVTANKVSARFEPAAQAVEPSKPDASKSITPGQAVYFSPSFKFDQDAQVVIYVQRNTDTGDVINQYPSKKVVEQYRQAAEQSHAKAPQLATTGIVAEAPKVEAKTAPQETPPAAAETAAASSETVTPDAVTSVKSEA